MCNFCQLIFYMRKINQLFTIATILIHTPIWIDHCNNSDTIQLDFNELFTSNLRLMISTIMSKLTAKNWYCILWPFLFHNFVDSVFAKASSHILNKNATIPAVPFCLGGRLHHICNSVTSKIAGE